MDVVDDFRRNYPRDDELATETRRCGLDRSGDDGDEEEVGIIRNAWSKMGYEWFVKEGRVAEEGDI